ncbi:Phosphate transport system permease protein PstA (TC 3.A.1.7.1) [hydrothermal vent metagenome]|uniref:Phosphate transport system permease protein PstA (TC 3.A.1.7.1) n=1 Tax=hydrothermal vent metagenome TaxID=652676 RepID=A0A3B0R3N2_9ZZZZ
MTDNTPETPYLRTPQEMQARLKRRYRKERMFKAVGLGGLMTGLLALAVMVISILTTGLSGFTESRLHIDVYMDPEIIGTIAGNTEEERRHSLMQVNYSALVRNSLRHKFPDVKGRRNIFSLQKLVSNGAREDIKQRLLKDESIIGKTITMDLLASSTVDMYLKGQISRHVNQSERKISDKQLAWIDVLQAEGRVVKGFNWKFLTSGDSREPELAGIWGAAMGSFLTLLVTLVVAFPIGVASALYLEEFAPKNKWTDFIEININNLAAVPSIIFGLLGLAIFLNLFNMPRSAPLVGGLTLALMTLPTIIISSRAAIRAVPPSIRDAAIGMGASKIQTQFHHVLPLSMPGIMTGTIIGMAQALGETAPLLMIGMVAFIVDVPHGVLDAATALPVQIFLWADSPERGFMEKTSAAIIVLLLFLVLMNGLAIWMRHKFEKRW